MKVFFSKITCHEVEHGLILWEKQASFIKQWKKWGCGLIL
jgi:hypothetical protein